MRTHQPYFGVHEQSLFKVQDKAIDTPIYLLFDQSWHCKTDVVFAGGYKKKRGRWREAIQPTVN